MNAPDTGGQAFPVRGSIGMTLRDYFAAKAMQGVLAGADGRSWFLVENGAHDAGTDAIYCYNVADAMLKARQA